MEKKQYCDYTGFAAYFSALGVWLHCAADYSKGSAKGFFECGNLVRILSIKDGVKESDMVKARII